MTERTEAVIVEDVRIDVVAKMISIGGFPVRADGYQAARATIVESIRARRKLAVLFANTHFVTSCQTLRPRFGAHPQVCILNDGIGLSLAAHLVSGQSFAENLNGTDFVPRLLADADAPLRVFLLGSTEQSVAAAAAALAVLPHVTIAGTNDGYSFWQAQDDLRERINAAKADIVLVALGSPLQEQWILDNWESLETPALFGVGALFDFLSGEERRAPLWMRRLGLEWFHRLWRNPRRLLYRYTVEAAAFFRLVWRHRAATDSRPLDGA
jgi:beta-1,4-glucosyltransferase